MPIDQFAWATGWNVALVSLTNVETDLLSYAQNKELAPLVPMYEPFPVREFTMDGVERGEGTGSIAWTWNVMPLTAYVHIISAYFYVAGVRVNNRQMTWNSLNDIYVYSRYNVTAFRPEPGSIEYDTGLVFDVVIRATVDAEL